MTSKVWRIGSSNNIKEAKSISPKQKRKPKKNSTPQKKNDPNFHPKQLTNQSQPSKPPSYSPSSHSKVPPTSEASKSKSGNTFNSTGHKEGVFPWDFFLGGVGPHITQICKGVIRDEFKKLKQKNKKRWGFYCGGIHKIAREEFCR